MCSLLVPVSLAKCFCAREGKSEIAADIMGSQGVRFSLYVLIPTRGPGMGQGPGEGMACQIRDARLH